jgi:hypothetical protein
MLQLLRYPALSARAEASRQRRLLPYRVALARKAPLDELIERIPRFAVRGVYAMPIDQIGFAGDARKWGRESRGFAISGDWDITGIRVRYSAFEQVADDVPKALTHNTVRALFVEGVNYRDTEQYAHMMRAVAAREPEHAYGATCPAEVDRYFCRLIQAYDTMRRHGYKTQRELGGTPTDEIRLYMTRAGACSHGNGGNHRIRIAELLGISEVPVVFSGGHPEWIAKQSQQRGADPLTSVRRAIGERFRALAAVA